MAAFLPISMARVAEKAIFKQGVKVNRGVNPPVTNCDALCVTVMTQITVLSNNPKAPRSCHFNLNNFPTLYEVLAGNDNPI
jgi:hypothetical protein